MKATGFVALVLLLALALGTVPTYAQKAKRHIDAACIGNGPPGDSTLVVVREFDLPIDAGAFAEFASTCRDDGGHVLLLRDYH